MDVKRRVRRIKRKLSRRSVQIKVTGAVVLLAAVAAVPIALANHSVEPPAYESHYIPPPPPAGRSAPTWADDFNRPDTPSGLGDGWDMRGRYAGQFPLPATAEGFIRNGDYTYSGDSIVYAARHFPSPVRSIGTTGRFRQFRGGPETTLALGLSANDQLITNMVQFVANRNEWTLTVRRSSSGEFEPVANSRFSPPLELNQDYTFAVEVTNTAISVRLPSGKKVNTKIDTAGLTGDWAFWQEYFNPEGPPAGTVFDFGSAWASEALTTK